MIRLTRIRRWIVGSAVLVLFLSASLRAQTPPQTATPITLGQLEQMAEEMNPVLGQARTRIRGAQGRMQQAGLYPNPSAGYTSDEVSPGPIIRGGEHGFFFEQEIVTAGKLGRRQEVIAQEVRELEAAGDIERLRVLTAVRILYYRLLASQRRIEIQERLAQLTREATDTSRQLFNVGQADEPDLLEVELEAARVELALEIEQDNQQRLWQQLAAAVGDPTLRPMELEDVLDREVAELDFDTELNRLLQESPEIRLAEAGVTRAQVTVRRDEAERFPNLIARGGLRYNRELLEVGQRPVGLEGFVDIGIEIPLFNRNQGNLAAARAELDQSALEVERVRLSLRSRFAAAYQEYKSGLNRVQKYRGEILPRAERAYELYAASFRNMAAAYPQVLIAQRTQLQLEAEFLEAMERLSETAAHIRGSLVLETPGILATAEENSAGFP